MLTSPVLVDSKSTNHLFKLALITGCYSLRTRYLYWAGPRKGSGTEECFEPRPLAFSECKPQPSHTTSTPANGASSKESGDDNPGNETEAERVNPDMFIPGDSKTERVVLGDVPESARRGLESKEIPTPSDSEGVAQSTDRNAIPKIKNALKRGQRPTNASELPARLPVQRESDLGSRNTRSKKPRIGDSAQEVQAEGAGTRETATHHPCTSPGLGSQGVNQPNLNHDSSGLSPHQPLGSSAILTDLQLQRTTLIVRVRPNSKFQALKFKEYPNVAAFYAKMLSIWAIPDSKVDEVTINFTWMDLKDEMRVMVLKKQEEATFLHLLEKIDDCPCWEEDKGKCQLDVDIFLKSSGS